MLGKRYEVCCNIFFVQKLLILLPRLKRLLHFLNEAIQQDQDPAEVSYWGTTEVFPLVALSQVANLRFVYIRNQSMRWTLLRSENVKRLRRSRLLANKSKLSIQMWQFSAEVSEYPQTYLKLSFGTIKMAVYANKKFA